MSPVAIALLVAAVALVVAAEWHQFAGGARPLPARRRKGKAQGSHLRVVHPEHEEFARSVERDLAALPTIDEHDVKRR